MSATLTAAELHRILPLSLMQREDLEERYPSVNIAKWYRQSVLPQVTEYVKLSSFRSLVNWNTRVLLNRSHEDGMRFLKLVTRIRAFSEELVRLSNSRAVNEHYNWDHPQIRDFDRCVCLFDGIVEGHVNLSLNIDGIFRSPYARCDVVSQEADYGKYEVGNHIVNHVLELASSMREDVDEFLTFLRRCSIDISHFERKVGLFFGAVEAFRDWLACSKDARLTDDAITLLQVYAIHHPAPQLAWLELTENRQQTQWRIDLLRSSLAVDPYAHYRVSEALASIEKFYSANGDLEFKRRRAVDERHFLLIESTKEVYWDGEKIKENWMTFRKSFEVLMKLARATKRGAKVPYSDLSFSLWNDVKGNMPKSFGSCVKADTGARSYGFHFPNERIVIVPLPIH